MAVCGPQPPAPNPPHTTASNVLHSAATTAPSTHLRIAAPQQEHHALAPSRQLRNHAVCEPLPALLGVRCRAVRPHRQHCGRYKQAGGPVRCVTRRVADARCKVANPL